MEVVTRLEELRAKYRDGKDLSLYQPPPQLFCYWEPKPPPRQFNVGDEVFVRCLVVAKDERIPALALQQISKEDQMVGPIITVPEQEVYDQSDFVCMG